MSMAFGWKSTGTVSVVCPTCVWWNRYTPILNSPAACQPYFTVLFSTVFWIDWWDHDVSWVTPLCLHSSCVARGLKLLQYGARTVTFNVGIKNKIWHPKQNLNWKRRHWHWNKSWHWRMFYWKIKMFFMLILLVFWCVFQWWSSEFFMSVVFQCHRFLVWTFCHCFKRRDLRGEARRVRFESVLLWSHWHDHHQVHLKLSNHQQGYYCKLKLKQNQINKMSSTELNKNIFSGKLNLKQYCLFTKHVKIKWKFIFLLTIKYQY